MKEITITLECQINYISFNLSKVDLSMFIPVSVEWDCIEIEVSFNYKVFNSANEVKSNKCVSEVSKNGLININ